MSDDKAAAALEAMGSDRSVTTLTQLEGGWSRHSWMMETDDGAGYVIRVKPPGALLDTDLGQEYRVFALLQDEPIPTPAVHALVDEEDTPFRGPFFVMDRAPGSSPNAWRKPDREQLEANWRDSRSIACDLASHLAHIHTIGAEQVGDAVTPRDFLANCDHWQGVHERTQLVRDPVIEAAYAWMRDRVPDAVEPSLVHGDYRPGNCLIDDGRVSAILDWELCHFGDPRFDLGYLTLDYTAGKMAAFGSSLLGAVADREWFYEEYARLSGRPVDVEVVRTFQVMGALMLIAILTTGLRMYADGKTTDVRFVWSRFAIPGLRQDIAHLMEW